MGPLLRCYQFISATRLILSSTAMRRCIIIPFSWEYNKAHVAYNIYVTIVIIFHTFGMMRCGVLVKLYYVLSCALNCISPETGSSILTKSTIHCLHWAYHRIEWWCFTFVYHEHLHTSHGCLFRCPCVSDLLFLCEVARGCIINNA